MRWLSILLTCMLCGCTSLAPPQVARPAQAEYAAFALNGRISASNQGERHSAGLRWTHKAESDEILLLSPLGQTVARVYRDALNATLDEGSKHYLAANVELLMQQALGWHLPMNGLHHWVLGMAAPQGTAQVERNSNGQIAILFQDGWEVRYLRYAGDKPDSLPARLQLRRESLQVQLLIDEWEWMPP